MSLHIVSNSFSQKNRIPIIHKKYVQKNKYKKKKYNLCEKICSKSIFKLLLKNVPFFKYFKSQSMYSSNKYVYLYKYYYKIYICGIYHIIFKKI